MNLNVIITYFLSTSLQILQANKNKNNSDAYSTFMLVEPRNFSILSVTRVLYPLSLVNNNSNFFNYKTFCYCLEVLYRLEKRWHQ